MALRMVGLIRVKSGEWFARKGIPADVRDEYERLYGVRWEAHLKLSGDTAKHEAKKLLAEWTAEVETRIAAPRGAADVVIRVDGKEVAKGRVPRTAALAFTANDAFDVGMDSYSPVSEAYFDRKPFKFNGRIDSVQIKYLH